MDVIQGAKDMSRADLFEAIKNRLDMEIAKAQGAQVEKLIELRDSLPDKQETFAKYLREAGVKKYGARSGRQHGKSIVRQEEI